MTVNLKVMLLVGVTCGFAGAAHAATYSEEGSFANSVSITDPSTPFALLPQPNDILDSFNSSLGTFESATVTWMASYTFSGTVRPGAGANGVGGAFGGGFSGSFGIDGIAYASGSLANGDATVGGPLNVSAKLHGTEGFSQTFPPDHEGILALFTGSSPIAFEWTTGPVTGADFGSLSVTGTLTASDSVTVTYTYTPVPELSTWAMLGLGFTGLAGAAALQGRRQAAHLAA